MPGLTDAVLERGLELAGAVCEHPFGAGVDVLKVGGRIFAMVGLGPPVRITLKVDPELGRALVDGEPAISPGYHMNKRHWITIDPLLPVDHELVLGLVEDAHDLVAARGARPGR
jgi:predicted DNA-binding protein (MmcQ/YjbR family)